MKHKIIFGLQVIGAATIMATVLYLMGVIICIVN